MNTAHISMEDVPLLYNTMLAIGSQVDLLLLLAATILYGSASWASFRYFRTTNPAARAGQSWISAGAGICMVLTVIRIAKATPNETAANAAALVLYLAGTALFWWTWHTTKHHRMDFAFTSEAPPTLHTAGPYALFRHPYYLAYMAGWLAPVIRFHDALAWGIFLGMALVYWRAALKEEQLIKASSMASLYAMHTRHMGPSASSLNTLLQRIFCRDRD